MTTPEQIAALLSEPEGERIEFKSAASSYHFDKLVDYCVALANEGGGKVILGVTDRRPRKVVGTKAFAEPGRAAAGLYEKLQQRISVEEITYQDKRLLIVHVPGRLPGTAWQYNGRYLRRAGDDLVPIPDHELRSMFAESGPDYSAEATKSSLGDLSDEAVFDFRQRWARKTGNAKILGWDKSHVLNDAELLTDGHPNIAALVLFGTHDALGRYLAQAEIIFEYRSSEASGPAQDRFEFREGFFLCHDLLWQRINQRNDRQSYQEGLFRYDIPTFDEVAIREALLNAVAHRDYRLSGSIFLRQFPRRLEVISPGGLPSGITPENILDQQNPRNRRLAEALGRCGFIERSGQGMNLMFEAAIRQSKPLPNLAGSAPHEVRLTLEGTVQDAEFIQFLERIGEEQLHSFSTHDFLLLDALRREQPLTAAQQVRVPALVEAGVIESHGRGRGVRYILSRGLYAVIGKLGAYTRRRGLDHDTNKALLLKHIRDNNAEGSPLSDLRQVLPSLSAKQVQNLLRQLRDEGRISMVNARRWARWHATEAKALNSN